MRAWVCASVEEILWVFIVCVRWTDYCPPSPPPPKGGAGRAGEKVFFFLLSAGLAAL